MVASAEKVTTTIEYKITALRAGHVPAARVSRGGLDDIDPEDIVYGEYAAAHGGHGNWLDLVYLKDDALRTFSGEVEAQHPLLAELKVLLRDEEKFYLIPIKEVPAGVAFKRSDIVDIKISSLIHGNERHGPSCIWEMRFEDGSIRSLEAEYQAYFAYGNTVRPASMTNMSLLDVVFGDDRGLD